jgi:hypothetical protein
MKKYITENEEVLEASSNLEIVNELKNSGRFTAGQTPTEYIKGFSKRYKEYAGVDIRSNSIDNFVEDLLSCEYLKEV